MSINIGDKPEMNVVNVGDELTQSQIDAINAGASPSTANPFMTSTAVSGTYLTQANAGTTYASLTANNTLTGTQAYNVNSAGAAFRISQAGAGEAFRVEDQTTPDTTPFVVTADGRVGIQTTTVGTNALAVSGTTSLSGNTTVTGTLSATTTITAGTGFTLTNGASNFNVTSGSSVPLTITNSGTGNSLVVNDVSGDTTPFVINNDGSVGIKRSSPSYDLDVNGTINASTYRFSDGTTQTTTAYNPSTDIKNALSGAASPSASNVFATMNDLSGGGAPSLPFTSTNGLDEYINFGDYGSIGVTLEIGQIGDPEVAYYGQNQIKLLDSNRVLNIYNDDSATNQIEYVNTYSTYPVFGIGENGLAFYDHTMSGNMVAQYGPTGITFPDNTVQTTAAQAPTEFTQYFEDTILSTAFMALDTIYFVSKMTSNGMSDTAFDTAGDSVARSGGSGLSLVTYNINAEITSSGHYVDDGSTFGYINSYTYGIVPYGDIVVNSYAPNGNCQMIKTNTQVSGNTTRVNFFIQYIQRSDDGYTFPNIDLFEVASANADWKIRCHVTVKIL